MDISQAEPGRRLRCHDQGIAFGDRPRSNRSWAGRVALAILVAASLIGSFALAPAPAKTAAESALPLFARHGGKLEQLIIRKHVAFSLVGNRLETHRLSPLSAPQALGRLSLDALACRDMAVRDDRAFVACARSPGAVQAERKAGALASRYYRLFVIDISDAARPKLVDSRAIAHQVLGPMETGIVAIPSYVYIAMRVLVDGDQVLVLLGSVVNVLTHAPDGRLGDSRVLPLLDSPSTMVDADRVGAELWVLGSRGSLEIFDARLPWSGAKLNSMPVRSRSRAARRLGDRFLVGGREGLDAYAIGAAGSIPRQVETLDLAVERLQLASDATMLAASSAEGGGVFGLVADEDGNLQPRAPMADATLPADRRDGLLVAADGLGGWALHRPSIAAAAGPEARIPGIGSIQQILMREGLGYVIRGNNKLAVLDLSDPLAPELLAQASFDGTISGMAWVGERLWVTLAPSTGGPRSPAQGLYAVDYDPTRSQLSPKRVLLPGDDAAVMSNLQAAEGRDRLLLATLDHGLWVVDVAADTASLRSTIAFDGATQIATAGDNYFLTAGGGETLQIYDLSDASQPVHIGEIAERYGAAAIVGHFLVLANDTVGGGAIYDIRSPQQPRLLAGGFPTDLPILFLRAAGENELLALDLQGKLYHVHLDAFGSTELLGSYGGSLAWQMDFDGRFIYLADGDQGLAIVARDPMDLPPTHAPQVGNYRALLPYFDLVR